MIQEDTTQRRVVMRGAMDTCCSLWVPIFPPADVFTPIVVPGRVDSGDALSHRTDSDIPESTRK